MLSIDAISRRKILQFAGATVFGRVAFARDSEFWNQKDPSSWTPEEVDRLLTNSPWAKEVTASSSGTNRGNGGGRSSGRSRGTG